MIPIFGRVTASVLSGSLAVLLCVCVPTISAQTPAGGALSIAVTTQGSVRLPGATVTIAALDGHVIEERVSDGDGTLQVNLQLGTYHVRASLNGFRDVTATVRV